MSASYPEDKKSALHSLLHSYDWKPRGKYPIQVLAKILGKIRHIAQILPFGNHLSIRLQLCLSKYVIRKIKSSPTISSMKQILKSAWNQHVTVHISASAARDLAHLQSILSLSNVNLWHCPLNLLIPIDPHFQGYSDACTLAMGGFCMELNFQWRLSNETFSSLPPWVLPTSGSPAWHINVYEFVALLINTYFMMHSFLHLHSINSPKLPNVKGWVFSTLADNASALSWMRQLSRTCDTHLS